MNLCCEILEFKEEKKARKHREDEKRPAVEDEEKGNILQKWEYLVATLDNLHPQGDDEIEERMCTWGKNGWELVSATAFSHVDGIIGAQCHDYAAGNTSTKMCVKLFFKRLKL